MMKIITLKHKKTVTTRIKALIAVTFLILWICAKKIRRAGFGFQSLQWRGNISHNHHHPWHELRHHETGAAELSSWQPAILLCRRQPVKCALRQESDGGWGVYSNQSKAIWTRKAYPLTWFCYFDQIMPPAGYPIPTIIDYLFYNNIRILNSIL